MVLFEHALNNTLSDPAIYPDYDEFRPDRFLDASGNEIDIAGTHGQGHGKYKSDVFMI